MPALEQNEFNNIIRAVRRTSSENVAYLRDATYRNLKRIGRKRDMEYAVTSTPIGSDQLETASIVAWMSKVDKDDWEAVKQLLGIDATLVNRC